jgi:two-component system CheB/CheR fusion protein
VAKSKVKSKRRQAEPLSELARFPIVGVGASAGGLDAFTRLLTHLTVDSGMGFVLVQHLSPEHQSSLSDILSRTTRMSVVEVTDGMRVKPNVVYVIPPNVSMGIKDGSLYLIPRGAEERPHLAIDFFFRSLAEDQGPDAIGVVLSGTGSDGAEGLKFLKSEGGISFAQLPESAKFGGMPERAISVDHVDFVLSPEDIASNLIRISKHTFLTKPAYDTGNDLDLPNGKDDVAKILGLIKQSTGVDFSQYKRTTVKRRIVRRMVVHKVEKLSDYYPLLKANKNEQTALKDDILINVSSFFRDAEVFEKLKKVIFPKLIKQRRPGDAIRIWIAGCATGEEAYSFAIALLEFLDDKVHQYPIQIFASDLSGSCITKARVGLYTDGISESVSPERLARFFVKTENGYQINKAVRDVCVFAKQDVVNDPPYSRLDIISCRNVLIYFESVLQKKVFSIFNYALKPTGFLVLGSSETPTVSSSFFSPAEKKEKIYSVNPKSAQTRPNFTTNNQPQDSFPHVVKNSVLLSTDAAERDTDRLIASHYAPPSVVINEQHEVLQFRGDTSSFLGNQTGRANFHILKMAKDGLAPHLKHLIETARKGGAAKIDQIKIRAKGSLRSVSLEVVPLRSLSTTRNYLIFFKEKIPEAQTRPVKKLTKLQDHSHATQRVIELSQELAESREYLESLNRDLESTNQDLQSANEEVLSANEELQSTNEELETAKEELQSGNEELTTVNDELQIRNVDLDRLNNDLVNLIWNVEIPILMIGKDGRIRRITPAAEKALNLQSSDVGRPMREIKSNFEVLSKDLDLERKVADVVDTMVATETEIQDRNSRWFRLQIRPYRTLDNRIDGAVIAFVDIDSLKRSLTEVNRARSEAEKAREAAEAGNRAKDLFLATLSHELRTPLTTILSYSQMLRMGRLNPEAAKKGVVMIEQSALAQAQLINDLLDVSRILMGKLALDLQNIDPVSLLHEAVESVRPSADRKLIKLEEKLSKEEITVRADPIRLKQIFLNLLTNAIKFSHSESVIEVTLDCFSEPSGDLIRVKIRDFGKGIPPAFLPQLFERFSQADSSSTRVHGGMGLGLAIVRSLTEAQGGNVRAESLGEGKGSTFTVTFPYVSSGDFDHRIGTTSGLARPNGAEVEKNKNDKSLSLKGIRILLVDDDPGARDSLGTLLFSLEAVVLTAESAQVAFEKFVSFRPDVLVSDIAMPGEDGYGLLQRIRKLPVENFGQVPAIALTAFASPDDVRRAFEAGFQAHLSKPVDSNNLAEMISEMAGSAART